jgi:hypothetical protein
MALRRDGDCAICAIPLPAGTKARWDPNARTTTCLTCCEPPDGSRPRAADTAATAVIEPTPSERAANVASDPAISSDPDVTVVRPDLDGGRAGGSAQREFERRKDKRESRVREKHPRLGGLILALSDEPQSTKAWAKGAEGERRVAQALDALRSETVVVLHDRRVPRSKANIDHLVVASSGIHVIDAKRYTGRIELRSSGTLIRPRPNQLFVNGRNKTNLAEKMANQVDVVRTEIADLLVDGCGPAEALIRPALCFVDADWSWFAKPMNLDGVLISGPESLTKMIAEPGDLTVEQVLQLGSRLAERLVPA